MSYSINNKALMNVESQFILWSSSHEKVKEIKSNVEGMDIVVVLYRGRWVYPLKNCPTPRVYEHTMNISTSHPKVQNAFKNFFPQIGDDKNIHCTSKDKDRKFKIRFFEDKSELVTKIRKEEEERSLYESPRWGKNLLRSRM